MEPRLSIHQVLQTFKLDVLNRGKLHAATKIEYAPGSVFPDKPFLCANSNAIGMESASKELLRRPSVSRWLACTPGGNHQLRYLGEENQPKTIPDGVRLSAEVVAFALGFAGGCAGLLKACSGATR